MVVACRVVASVVAYSPEMCPAMSSPVRQVMAGRSEVEMGSVRINFIHTQIAYVVDGINGTEERSEVEMGSVRINFIHTQIAYVVDGINGTEEIFNTDEAYVFGL